MSKPYSLRKCRQIFKEAVVRHKKLANRVAPELMATLERSMEALDQAVLQNNVESARLHAFEVEQFLQEHGRKNYFDHVKEFVIAVVIALIIAAIVRQMWFELYEIPSGSMRPTFRENDRVLVFKDAFGINKPFETDHFYFQPELVQRGSIVVLTGDQLDLPDVDTTYFGLFPGKRRYVKRCPAKDGDIVYFYGGKIYGIDKEGKPLENLLTSKLFSTLEYIPFISFEGKVEQIASKDTSGQTLILRHMNIPVASIALSPNGILNGKVIDSDHSFGTQWGIQNFAMSRLLEPQELPSDAKAFGYMRPDAKLYLEVKHNPKLPQNEPLERSGAISLINTDLSWIALNDDHMEQIKKALYTGRFYVKKGIAFRYTPEGPDLQSRGVLLDRKIPDGCYEFIDGAAYEVGWGAITHLLPEDHPLYPHTTKLLKTLYNCGIEFSTATNNAKQSANFPARYAYFRDGSLFTLGKPIFEKDDTTLRSFLDKEERREKLQSRYKPFRDSGPPLIDGKFDIEFIRSYGLPIQENHYLLLGDNHAMSNDSRFFGAVPQKNLQGSPALIFWPPGERWGRPPQPPIPFIRTSNMIVLSAVIVIGGIAIWIFNRRASRKSFEHTRNRRLKKGIA